ncbi:chorismate mutase [Streptomyces prunicolor]|uniref:chorismate mutase n=1 Tax=Streptomyces prunicolor TaxID=67348 RepID=UPI0038649FDE|nr:chorismate mutase [Streptomyces prunicolor]WSV18249.1 chorismate mutase [Streptomyces prunicolor]
MTQQSTGDLAADAVEIDLRNAIENDRQEIDALDSKIIELIQSRHRVSSRIQRRRQSGGGPRTELARETVVIDRYRQALGPEGTTLVTDILRLCRGPAPEAGAPAAAGRGRQLT